MMIYKDEGILSNANKAENPDNEKMNPSKMDHKALFLGKSPFLFRKKLIIHSTGPAMIKRQIPISRVGIAEDWVITRIRITAMAKLKAANDIKIKPICPFFIMVPLK